MKVSVIAGGRRRALIDSSAYLALLDRDDKHHEAAREILSAVMDAGFRLLTTNFIVAETHALVLSVLGHRVARAFLGEVGRGKTRILRVEEGDEERARDIIFHYEDKDFSLVDCLSFAVMERLSIPYAFAFDRHFAQYGVETLE